MLSRLLLAGALAVVVGNGAVVAADPASDLRPYPERVAGEGRLTYIQDTPVMFLSGTPEELGRQQAKLIGDVINPMLDMPRDVVAHHGYAHIWPLVTAMSRILVNNAPPHYQREINAFIEAGKLNRDGIYVGNSLVELRRIGGCSAFVVLPKRSKSGELLFGRNFDFPSFGVLDKYHCLMIVRPKEKHAFASIGYPGMVGVISGINDAGLSVATLDVYRSADGAPIFDPTGVPLAMTYRRLLEECSTIAEAEALLKSVKRTTYMNLAVADAEQAVVFEITPLTVGVRPPVNSVLTCTNHFRLNGLWTNESCRRMDALNAANRGGEKFGVSDVQKVMHRVNQGEMTLQTMVFEPKSLQLHLAMGGEGPVSNDPLKTFDLRELFSLGAPVEEAVQQPAD